MPSAVYFPQNTEFAPQSYLSVRQQEMIEEGILYWQKELHYWKNTHKLFSKSHPAWKALETFYKDFLGDDFDKEKGMEILALQHLFEKSQEMDMGLKYTSENSPIIFQKIHTILRSLQKEQSLDFSVQFQQWLEKIAATESINDFKYLIVSSLESYKPEQNLPDNLMGYTSFVLAGAVYYAEKYLGHTLLEVGKASLFEGDFGQSILSVFIDSLPKKGLKHKIRQDIFWHTERLLLYYQHHKKEEKHPGPYLTWGGLTQLRKSQSKSMQPTLFTPVSEEQTRLQNFRQKQFSVVFFSQLSQLLQNMDLLQSKAIYVGILSKNDLKAEKYKALQADFSQLFIWQFTGQDRGVVFGTKRAPRDISPCFIGIYHIPHLVFPLSMKVLKDIFGQAEEQPNVAEASPIYLSPKKQAKQAQSRAFYPLLAPDNATEELGEGVFSMEAKGLNLPKEKYLYAHSADDLQQQVTQYLTQILPENQPKIQINALFEKPLLDFKPQYITALETAPFQKTNIYFEPTLWKEGLHFAQVFSPSQPQIFIHLAADSIYASKLPFVRGFMGKMLTISRYQYDVQGKAHENIRQKALQKFKSYYETQWQEKSENLRIALQNLLNMSYLENCQVEPEFALELRPLVLLSEDTVLAKQLFQTIYKPNEATQKHFKTLREGFLATQKAFRQMGKRYCRGKQTYDALQQYFSEGSQALAYLEEHLEEAARKEIDLEKEISYAALFEYCFAALQVIDWEIHLPKKQIQIPLYRDFWRWAELGKELLNIQLNHKNTQYNAKPLKISEKYLRKKAKKIKLNCSEEKGELLIQDQHSEWLIEQIPSDVLKHRLGKKTSIECLVQALLENTNSAESETSRLETQKNEIKNALQLHIRYVSEILQIQGKLKMMREED